MFCVTYNCIDMFTEQLWYAAVGPIAYICLLLVYSLLSKIGSKFAEAFMVLYHKDDVKYAEELQDNKTVTCEICFEEQQYSQMFMNSTCSHSFCYECTIKHATTKIQEHRNVIACPGLNCKSTLDNDMLRSIIPKDALIKWDDFLCESSIIESEKLYCPFGDCSVLLINDDCSITKTDCPVCKRSICAVCRVPWHSEFSCQEFGKLNTIMKGKEDEMVVALAEKKKWRKCPKCKFFVEKANGCAHITCRCKYEFCYNCGDKWSSAHGGCRPRS